MDPIGGIVEGGERNKSSFLCKFLQGIFLVTFNIYMALLGQVQFRVRYHQGVDEYSAIHHCPWLARDVIEFLTYCGGYGLSEAKLLP